MPDDYGKTAAAPMNFVDVWQAILRKINPAFGAMVFRNHSERNIFYHASGGSGCG
jgi:hypothetical protein